MSLSLFDAHCDTAFELWRRKEGLEENSCHISLNKARNYGAYAQIFAFCSLSGYDLPFPTQELLTKPLEMLRWEVEKHADRIGFARDREEILRLNQEGKVAAMLSIEGPELIGCEPDRLWELKNQGFCMSTLTWNADNALAGFHESDRGLSEQGRAYVKAARELGIYIDVSHLGEASFWDLTEITEKPILASHSNCRDLCNHSRNLSDDQLKAIAQSGGVVGLNLYVSFLGERADFDTLHRHLEHMLKLCGEKHVCLGGDLDGCEELPQGFRSVADYGSFYGYLKGKGYEESLLADIFYNNLLALF